MADPPPSLFPLHDRWVYDYSTSTSSTVAGQGWIYSSYRTIGPRKGYPCSSSSLLPLLLQQDRWIVICNIPYIPAPLVHLPDRDDGYENFHLRNLGATALHRCRAKRHQPGPGLLAEQWYTVYTRGSGARLGRVWIHTSVSVLEQSSIRYRNVTGLEHSSDTHLRLKINIKNDHAKTLMTSQK